VEALGILVRVVGKTNLLSLIVTALDRGALSVAVLVMLLKNVHNWILLALPAGKVAIKAKSVNRE